MVLAHYSQLCDILGDPLGQSLEVLVAAADNRVEAGAFLWALGPGDAGGLLLTCTRYGKPPSHKGSALMHRVRPDSMLCACPGWLPLPCQPSSPALKQDAAPAPRNHLPHWCGYNQPAQHYSDFHHFHAKKKCSHRDNIRAQKKGLSPANPPETISFTISQTQVRWSRAYAEQPEELALLPFPT